MAQQFYTFLLSAQSYIIYLFIILITFIMNKILKIVHKKPVHEYRCLSSQGYILTDYLPIHQPLCQYLHHSISHISHHPHLFISFSKTDTSLRLCRLQLNGNNFSFRTFLFSLSSPHNYLHHMMTSTQNHYPSPSPRLLGPVTPHRPSMTKVQPCRVYLYWRRRMLQVQCGFLPSHLLFLPNIDLGIWPTGGLSWPSAPFICGGGEVSFILILYS